MIEIDTFLKSPHCPSGLDKIHGQKTARAIERDGGEVTDTYEIPELELERQKVEKTVGKYVYYVDKGNSALHDFFDEVKKSSPGEIIQIRDGLEEIKFTDFSVYRTKNYWGTYMDVKEVILPPKTKQTRGTARLYILAYDGKLYNLPELEYPKTISPFLKWLKKKKKIHYDPSRKPIIWNGDKNLYDSSGNLSWIEIGYGATTYGFPIRNLKTKGDIDEYNIWLKDVYVPKVQETNKVLRAFKLPIPGKLCPIEIAIDQTDVDNFISEWNNKYQVKK